MDNKKILSQNDAADEEPHAGSSADPDTEGSQVRDKSLDESTTAGSALPCRRESGHNFQSVQNQADDDLRVELQYYRLDRPDRQFKKQG